MSDSHLFSHVLIPEEKPGTQVFFGDIVAVNDDKLTDAGEHNVLYGLGRDALQPYHQDSGVSHPNIDGMKCTTKIRIGGISRAFSLLTVDIGKRPREGLHLDAVQIWREGG